MTFVLPFGHGGWKGGGCNKGALAITLVKLK